MSPAPPLPAFLETERLLMRPVTLDDLAFLVEMHLDSEVTRYLGGDGEPRSPEKTREWVDDTMRWYAEADAGQFLVLGRKNGRPLGRAGFGIFELERTPSASDGIPIMTWGPGSSAPGTDIQSLLEVGYSMVRAAWGAGCATEAARAWYEYALGPRGEDTVYSVIHPENIGSIRVAEKNGLTCGEQVRLDGHVYALWSSDARRG